MKSTLCIFEDDNYTNLLPLVYTRPVYDLKCGLTTLRDKIQAFYPGTELTIHCRKELVDVLEEENPGTPINQKTGTSCLFINGRILADNGFAEQIPVDGEDTIYIHDGNLVAVRISGENLKEVPTDLDRPLVRKMFPDLPVKEVDVVWIRYFWDLVHHNAEQIKKDFTRLFEKGKINGTIHQGVHLINKSHIRIGEGSVIKPGAVLDAEKGPVIIGKNTTIMPNAVITGPAFIGDNSLIKIGAKIYGGTSIGEVCKIGGEVEETIIHGYSNKQHDGYLGHSYLGSWINIGADTNNSDLKNNYRNVQFYVNEKMVDTGSQFVGLVMGDHSKTGINTMFNTGTYVGYACNIYGAGFPPKYIPSFSWGGKDKLMTHQPKKALAVAKTVAARRDIRFTPAFEKLFIHIFDITRTEREKTINNPYL